MLAIAIFIIVGIFGVILLSFLFKKRVTKVQRVSTRRPDEEANYTGMVSWEEWDETTVNGRVTEKGPVSRHWLFVRNAPDHYRCWSKGCLWPNCRGNCDGDLAESGETRE